MSIRSTPRIWELDLLRCLALFFMFVQHSYIIWHFVRLNHVVARPAIIDQIGHLGAYLFLFLVGVSGYLSYSQRLKTQSVTVINRHFWLRGVSLIGWGMVLTLATWLVLPARPIIFGVLHFIGVAILMLPFFIPHTWLSRVMVFVSLVLGSVTPLLKVENWLWIPFGITPKHFDSLDYWPVFPWLALVLVGLETARNLFVPKDINNISSSTAVPRGLAFLQWCGKHTLLLYLIHIPVLALIFFVIQRLIL